ncbi:hypothetical protein ES705_12222 [subsurface metagenome]
MWLGLYHGECTGCNKFNPEDKVRLLKRGEKPSGAAKLEGNMAKNKQISQEFFMLFTLIMQILLKRNVESIIKKFTYKVKKVSDKYGRFKR